MRFLIFGAGALGQALGCMLAVAGHQADMVLRRRFVGVIKEKGATGIREFLASFAAAPEMVGAAEDIADCSGDYDYALITTKAYDTRKAGAAIASLPDCRCPVVSMQNGCGNIELLADIFGPARTLGARVITGFEIAAPGHVRITVSADAVHIGAAVAGAIAPEAQTLAAIIDQAGLPCEAVADIHRDLYAKLLYNCALNPLGAILGVALRPAWRIALRQRPSWMVLSRRPSPSSRQSGEQPHGRTRRVTKKFFTKNSYRSQPLIAPPCFRTWKIANPPKSRR